MGDQKIEVIPNGVTLPDVGSAESVHAFGLTPGRYALCVGRLVPEKGVHVVIDAFRSLTDTGLDLAIVGAPRYSRDYAARLERTGGDYVRLIGQQTGSTLGALYANAAVFVTASRNEGHPLAVLEAMGFGLPIVASDIPAHREVLDGAGVLFATDDPISLASAIRTAMTNVTQDPREVIARSGFAWDSVAERTYTLLMNVVRGAHA
jgi:glycosyltransferase involved in cell wall biosynthesis